MKWPDRPTCHGDVTQGGRFNWDEPVWRDPRPYVEPNHPEVTAPYEETWRTCSYCGSIHPEDLFNLLTNTEPREDECMRCYSELHPEPTFKDENNPTSDELKDWQNWSRSRYSPHTCRVTLHGSDWKYGWPHKFYVEGIPNPIGGRLVPFIGHSEPIINNGFITGRVKRSREFGHAPLFQRAKWYNTHLLDEGFDDEALKSLIQEMGKTSHVHFEVVTGRLKYGAPRYGYQSF